MCLKMNYYPLVIDEDGKKKILFQYGVHISDINSFDEVTSLGSACVGASAGLSSFQSLNKLFKKEKYKEFIKMVSVPCGCCSECLQSVAREWAFRIHLETLDSSNCWFVTLTYDDEHLPDNMMLVKNEISDFNKKLKVYLNRKNIDSKFRFYGVGEYGSKGLRPHYHVIYFDLPLDDLKYHSKTENGDILYTSEFLSSVWSKGYVIIGQVSIGSACYVARYCDKKKRLSKFQKDKLIEKGVVPEFNVMSRRPGIGARYYDNLKNKFIDGDYEYYINGQSYSIPISWLKKIKNDEDIDINCIKDYELNARIKSSQKINYLLSVSQACDLDSYLDDKDVIKIKRKL